MPQGYNAALPVGGQRRCSNESRIHVEIGCLRSGSKRPFMKFNVDATDLTAKGEAFVFQALAVVRGVGLR